MMDKNKLIINDLIMITCLPTLSDSYELSTKQSLAHTIKLS